MTDWYKENVEPEVREVVKALRDNGINTRASCGHKMWILCECYDPSHDLTVVNNVLYRQGVERYTLTVTVNHLLPVVQTKGLKIEIHPIRKNDEVPG